MNRLPLILKSIGLLLILIAACLCLNFDRTLAHVPHDDVYQVALSAKESSRNNFGFWGEELPRYSKGTFPLKNQRKHSPPEAFIHFSSLGYWGQSLWGLSEEYFEGMAPIF